MSNKHIIEIKEYVSYLQKKYELNIERLGLQWYIEVNKSRMWEILCTTTSHGLRGFGKFPTEYAEEFDKDMNRLKELTEKL